MSRAISSFAQAFPAATRSARDRAKERERSKLYISQSPGTHLPSDSHGLCIAMDLGAVAPRVSTISNTSTTEQLQHADDTERGGDILNGVGSASSHTSTVSSVFSATAQSSVMTTFGASRNPSSLTPLTNHESSPLRPQSPRQGSNDLLSSTSNSLVDAKALSQFGAAIAHADPLAFQAEARTVARDINKKVLGSICVYNPELDLTSSDGKKKTKPIYKEFGAIVRILESAGERHLIVFG